MPSTFPYRDSTDPAHLLDLYLPSDTSSPCPIAVFIHGGAWLEGDKDIVTAQAGTGIDSLRRALTHAGYAVASLNYRLAGSAPHPAQIDDVLTALAWLIEHAPEFAGDPTRVVVMGESAGGHLALLAGSPAAQRSFGPKTAFEQVRAIVAYYPVTHLDTIEADREALAADLGLPAPFFEGGPGSPEGILLGGIDPADPANADAAAQASPTTYLDRTCPPTLLLHGTIDDIVPAVQSERVHAKLIAAGVPTELILIEATHAEPQFYTRADLMTRVMSFVDHALA